MMKPKAFWRLTVEELRWLIEAKTPPKMYLGMTESQVAAIYEETYGTPES